MYAELNSVMTIAARSTEFSGKSSGNASGTSTCDMNSSVIKGTPRNTSMNTTHSTFTTGRLLRRPSASAMPMGRLSVMPLIASSRLSIRPPQSVTFTGCSPGAPSMPRSSTSVSRKASTPSTATFRADPQGRVAGQRPPQGHGRQVGDEQQSHVQPHSLHVVGEEGEGGGDDGDGESDSLEDASSRDHPGHPQQRGDHQQGCLRPPEAVVARTGLVGVVLADEEEPADAGDDAPVGAQEDPAQAKPEPQQDRCPGPQSEQGVEPGS